MIRRLHWAAAIFSLLPLSAAPNSGIIQVTGLRSWSHPGSTRIIIETSGLAEYHADRALNPDRLFFDILHARPWIAQRRLASREVNDTLVKRVRVAETSPGTTRVVFDLVGAAEYTVSRLDTPDRIVIELTTTCAKPHAEPDRSGGSSNRGGTGPDHTHDKETWGPQAFRAAGFSADSRARDSNAGAHRSRSERGLSVPDGLFLDFVE